MADPFSKWRDRRVAQQAARTTAAAPSTAAARVAIYEALYLNRGGAALALLLWTPIVLGLIIVMVLHEAELNAIPYSTGMRVAAMLLAFASLIVVPLVLPTARRSWVLYPDRLDIRERPFIPPLGFYRHARLPFGEIAMARLGEALSGMSLFEIQTKNGRRYRLAPRTIGKGKDGRLDHEGLDAFIDAIRAAIQNAGLPVPPGEELRTATSGVLGLAILGAICALLGALCLFGVWTLLQGEPIGMQALAFGVPFLLLFAGLLRNRWRKWRARG